MWKGKIPPAAAITDWGMSSAMAPKIRGGMCLMTLARAATGAGNVQFTMEPSGAVIFTGRIRPSLLKMYGASIALMG